MIIVGRHINGITLNDLEYLLESNGDYMEFENKEKAIDFLKSKGATDTEIEWFTFKKMELTTCLNCNVKAKREIFKDELGKHISCKCGHTCDV